MEINSVINKVNYNSFQERPHEEHITFEIVSKFGTSKDNPAIRAFFFEISINAVDEEDEPTRNFLLDISFQYKLDKSNDSEPNEEDDDYYRKCLKLVNDKIITYTGQDERKPFNIEKAIEDFETK